MSDIRVSIEGIERLLAEEKTDVYQHVLSAMERVLFTATLKHFKGNQTKMSAALGLARFTVRRKLAELGIRAEDYIHGVPEQGTPGAGL